MPAKNWVFDLDGTLVDSFAHYFKILSDVYEEQGRVFCDEDRLTALTQPLPLFLTEALGEKGAAEAMTVIQTRSESDALEIRPFPGIPELVSGLRARGERVAVWTNRDLVSAELILKYSGLAAWVEISVSGTCVKKRKPDPEGLGRILKEFGSAIESVTVIGDHEHDILAAKSAGARAIRASWHSYWPIAECTRADFQFRSVASFSSWLGLAPTY